MVCYRPDRIDGAAPDDLVSDLDRIIAIEVKKLERTPSGKVARASGLDYNTTPPCGRVRVYDASGATIDVRAFYLFVCLEPSSSGRFVITGLSLVDGNALNADFNLYLEITGERTKRIDLGTYRDGADRARPMIIFANPLGAPAFDRLPLLVHPDANLVLSIPAMRLVHRLRRSPPRGGTRDFRDFFCYRWHSDVPANCLVTDLVNPFPTPSREERTRPRGRFRLPFRL